VAHCTFSGNAANIGGGMANYNSSSPSLTDCTFAENSAASGGGMANYTSSAPALTHCIFAGNEAQTGAGMLNDHSSPQVTGCTFAQNEAVNGSGGGMYNFTGSSPTLTNCTFVGNTAFSMGGGIVNYNAGTPILTNCTFSGNSANTGGGIYDRSSLLTATNSILWGDTPDEISVHSTPPVVTYSDVQGADVYPGDGNILANPAFDDAATQDLDLLEGSPCIDVGTNDAPNLPPHDFEGDPRIWDGDFDGTATADMGADEFGFHTVTIGFAGNGSGLVSLEPPGGHYEHGTVVTLTAIADPVSSFTGWSGDAGGTGNPVTLTMDRDKVVTATFITHRVYLPLVIRSAP
jgi:parallel beta-helix repeat protein